MSAPLHIALVTETCPPEVHGVAMTVCRVAAATELVRHGDNGMLAEPGAGRRFVRAALDREQVHDPREAALRGAIAWPALPPDGGAIHRIFADQ